MPERKLLLGTLAKLLELPFADVDDHSAVLRQQETLDFLAMLAGIKPVFMTGRGFHDDLWIRGVIELASETGLDVEIGPMWNALAGREGLPEWFVRFAIEAHRSDAVFISKEAAAAQAVHAAVTGNPVSIADEAALLGYPACCVRAEYQRNECLDRAYFMMLSRAAGEDQQRIRFLIDDDVRLDAETPAEIAMLEAASAVNMAPFTSVNMCGACASDLQSPARKIAAEREQLARSIDLTFADSFPQR